MRVLVLWMLVAVLGAWPLYGGEDRAEAAAFRFYFSDLKTALLNARLEPDMVERLLPFQERSFRAFVYDKLTPEQKKEWIALQNAEYCRRFNRDVLSGKADYAAFAVRLGRDCPHLARTELSERNRAAFAAGLHDFLRSEAAATPLPSERSLNHMAFASEAERRAFARYARCRSASLLGEGFGFAVARRCGAAETADFKRMVYDRMPNELRMRWLTMTPEAAKKDAELASYEAALRLTFWTLAVRRGMLELRIRGELSDTGEGDGRGFPRKTGTAAEEI